MGDLTKNFSRSEFACKCGCGFDGVSLDLVTKLQGMRNHTNFPIVITSGCRCPQHNAAEGGVSSSAHVRGTAADIRVTNTNERFQLLDLALTCGFSRIGIAKTFIHVDVDSSLPREVVWLYS